MNANELTSELKYYGHNVKEEAVARFLTESNAAKSNLRNMLEKIPSYIGDGRVVIKEDFERDINTRDVIALLNEMTRKIDIKSVILKNTTEDGKKLSDLILDSFKDMPEMIPYDNIETISSKPVVFDVFNENGFTRKSADNLSKFMGILNYFKYECMINTTLDHYVDEINSIIPELKFVKGMKTSRAFNRIWEYFGFKGNDKYNYYFAKYADMINATVMHRKVVISVNPIDFLRMSFGNSWSSCHTIDPENKREISMTSSNTSTYHGAYMGGTLSYALDNTSMIMYVVNEKGDENVEDKPKIYRCMFHYKDGYLIQGRVYPQCKDGSLDLYKKLKYIMQEKICEANGIEFVNQGSSSDSWKLFGDTYDNRDRWDNEVTWESYGHHYRDYDCYDGCNLSKLKSIADNISNITNITIGHCSICLKCGKYEYEDRGCSISSNSLIHDRC